MDIIDNTEHKFCTYCFSGNPERHTGQFYITSIIVEGTHIMFPEPVTELYAQRWYCDNCSRSHLPVELENVTQILVKGNEIPSEVSEIEEKVDYSPKGTGDTNFGGLIYFFSELYEAEIEYAILKNPFYLAVDGMLLYDKFKKAGVEITDFITEGGLEVPSGDEKELVQSIARANGRQNPYHRGIKLYRES